MSRRSGVPSSTAFHEWIRRHALPLAGTLGFVAVLVGVFIAANPDPVNRAGLYLTASDAIRANGWLVPETIPYYTDGGVPFGYPPLGFYILAVLQTVGLDSFTIVRVFPGIYLLGRAGAMYAVGHAFTTDRRIAAFAAIIASTEPIAVWPYLPAGGVIRALSSLFAYLSAAAGAYYFRGGHPQLQTVAGIAFGLALLTRPNSALWGGALIFIAWVSLDRSRRGFIDGFRIFSIGVALSVLWWGWVLLSQGTAPFEGAIGHYLAISNERSFDVGGRSLLSGLRLSRLAAPFSLLTITMLIGGLNELLEQRPALPLIVVGDQVLRGGHMLFAGSLLASVALLVVLPRALNTPQCPTLGDFIPTGVDIPSVNAYRSVSVALVIAVVLATVIAGLGVAGGALYYSDRSDYVTTDDRAALSWIDSNAPSDAVIVSPTPTAEWIPVYAHRTLGIGPWGTEWEGHGEYERQVAAFEQLKACTTIQCVQTAGQSVGVEVDYLLVHRGGDLQQAAAESSNATVAVQQGETYIYALDEEQS